MTLPKKIKEDRVLTLIKAYLVLKKKGTSKQIVDFINFNNFGVDITTRQVDRIMHNNRYRKSSTGRCSIKNCYEYEDTSPRTYYIHKDK